MGRARNARLRSAALGLFGLVACAESSGVITIEKTRVVDVAGADPRMHASSAERFGLPNPGVRPGATLRWETPPGWSELAATSMRAANFRVAGDERAECSLTLLPGDAGGLAANLNRWRAQMSLAPQSAVEIAALPRTELLGRAAVEIDLEGTWVGMSGQERGPDYRMVGWLAIDPDGSKFLRIVGPKSVVDGELDAFRALGRSFERGSAPGPFVADDTLPGSSGQSPGIVWEMPAGWRRAPDRPLRVASFFVGSGESVECYVTLLTGDGGGALANVNRWRKQMGQEPVTAEGFAALSRTPMLDAEGWLVEIAGTFEGSGGSVVPDALLLGALGSLPGRAVFVKMTGPRDVVEREREAFLALCKSLTREG